MTTLPSKKKDATSVPVRIIHREVRDLQTLTAAAVVGAELFARMGMALSSMAKAMSPLLKIAKMTLAEERYWSSFDTNYWLIRDDSPMFATRVKGYIDGYDPVCFNCEHKFTDHRHDDSTTWGPLNMNSVRTKGGSIDCLEPGCDCKFFHPSFVEGELFA